MSPPSAVMIAPVRVARSIMTRGWKRPWQYQSASASTRRPSASVLIISTVCPDNDFTMSPGRCAPPSGMFSTRPRMPTALTCALRAARAYIAPATAAAPLMSMIISSIRSAGLRLIPPASKQTPLPTNATGGADGFVAPRHCRTANWLSRPLPWPTPRSAPMPSVFISASPSTSTCNPRRRQTGYASGELRRIKDVSRF